MKHNRLKPINRPIPGNNPKSISGNEDGCPISPDVWDQMVERTALTLADLLDSSPQFQRPAARLLLEGALALLPKIPISEE